MENDNLELGSHSVYFNAEKLAVGDLGSNLGMQTFQCNTIIFGSLCILFSQNQD